MPSVYYRTNIKKKKNFYFFNICHCNTFLCYCRSSGGIATKQKRQFLNKDVISPAQPTGKKADKRFGTQGVL